MFKQLFTALFVAPLITLGLPGIVCAGITPIPANFAPILCIFAGFIAFFMIDSGNPLKDLVVSLCLFLGAPVFAKLIGLSGPEICVVWVIAIVVILGAAGFVAPSENDQTLPPPRQ